MELTGDLSDFPLTDILQILALSRKTGTLALEAGVMNGRIIIEQGRITQASLRPGGTFADRLLQENMVTAEVLGGFMRVGGGDTGWTLESLLVESGVMTSREVELAAKRHIHTVVAALVCLERGRFGIALNQAGFQDSMSEIRLEEGLDIGEVLLEAATETDEVNRTGGLIPSFGLTELLESEERPEPSFDPFAETEVVPRGVPAPAAKLPQSSRPWGHATAVDDDRSLYSFLAELRSHSFEAEVSLLIMRYASEVVSRGILFVVKETEICGLGQFGVEAVDHRNADERVREITIPLGGKSLFDNVVKTGAPFIGKITESYWHTEMLSHIGGSGRDLTVFALPITCNDELIFILYGDNYPDMRELVGIDALVTLVNQASIVLEKIVLERVVRDLRGNNGYQVG